MSAAVKAVFKTYKSSLYRPVAKKTKVGIMVSSLVAEAQVIQ